MRGSEIYNLKHHLLSNFVKSFLFGLSMFLRRLYLDKSDLYLLDVDSRIKISVESMLSINAVATRPDGLKVRSRTFSHSVRYL